MDTKILQAWDKEIIEQEHTISLLQRELNKQKAFRFIHKLYDALSLYFDKDSTILLTVSFNNTENQQQIFLARGEFKNNYAVLTSYEIKNLGADYFLPDIRTLTDEFNNRSQSDLHTEFYENKVCILKNDQNGVITSDEFVKVFLKTPELIAEYKTTIYDKLLSSKDIATSSKIKI